MQKKLLVVVLGTLFALPALADTAPATAPAAPAAAAPEAAPTPALTSNVGLVSNYLYRGISQSGSNPALQGGFDYVHASGFYVGAWGSSISWIGELTGTPASGLELDTYLGFKNSFATDFSYDVGFLRYNYPGNYPNVMLATADGTTPWAKADTNEVYGLIGYKWLTLKYSDSLGSTFALPNAAGSSYIDLTATYPIADTSYTVIAHVGRQALVGKTADNLRSQGVDPSYSDYKLTISKDLSGLGKDLSGYVASIAYSLTTAENGPGQFNRTSYGTDNGRGTAVVSIVRTF